MRLSSASVLVAPATILLLFAGAIAGKDRLAFRDVSHFYTPLYDYVASRTSDQWLPLWNPLDETGIPLVGETTTAVCYPIRYAIFSLPVETETAIAWYVVLHFLIASITAWWAARWSAVGPIAAAIAGVVYPLSGSLLFLYTNPPFLVGAAWLPLVLGVMVCRIEMSITARILIGGVSMAMMILGGDPQTALHGMILAAMVWVVRLVRRSDDNIPWQLLVAIPCLAAVLTMPQMAASVSWSRQSERTEPPQADGWLDPPVVGSLRYRAYQYSLAPWHTLELATPSAFGSLLPENRRISRLIPGDGRTWTPSIYMGMLVAVALLSAFGRRRADGVDPWLMMGAVSLVMAMGHFGLVWWMQTVTGTMADLDSAAGGPYWILYRFVPGYDAFRYPVKWLTPFALAAAVATALSIDRGLAKPRVIRVATFLGGAFVLAVVFTTIARWNPQLIFARPTGTVVDEFWGPLDFLGGLAQINRSLIHSAVCLLAIITVVGVGNGRGWSTNRVATCLLLLTTLELAVAARSIIANVPADQERNLISRLAVRVPGEQDARWMRTQSGGGWPAVWKERRDPERLLDVEASGRVVWFGRWHLKDRAAVLNNMVSIRSRAIARFWQATRQATADMTAEQREEFWVAIRDWLHIGGVLHSTSRVVELESNQRIAQLVEYQRIVVNQHPPLRVHGRWTNTDRPEPTSGEFAERLLQIADRSGSAVPVVQAAKVMSPASENSDNASLARAVERAADHASYDLQLSQASLLTRPVLQDGHWKAEYAPVDSNDWQTVSVDRVDQLKQGVILPAGDWQLRFRYAPWWLGWSLALAAAAWILVLAVTTRLWFRRTRSLTDAKPAEHAIENVVGVNRTGDLAE